nr:unnamed protein product [Digitaria exilis]
MGKKKGRASSSGMAASLVPHAQGAVPTVGFGGFHGAVRVEPAAPSDPSDPIRLTPDVDGEVLQNLKRLGRKDPTTKLKALSALSILFAQKPGEEVVQIVPQWAFEYKRLLLDYNREVRRATHEAMSSLVTAIKKGIAPHLKSLMGPWWFSQFDPAPEVAQAARRSFEAAFPQSERRLDALMLCVKETFLYLSENLKLTTQALSDKATPMDELEDMHQRSFSWLLENVSRYSGEVSSDDTPIKLITDILAKIVWRDYLLLSVDTTSGGVPLSHKNSGLAANTQYPVYYLQDLEKCIVEILDVIANTEDHLLNVSCELLVRDCLDIIQQGEKLPKFQDHVEQLVSFFLSLDQLVVHKGITWPLERLARPLVEQSLPAIKFTDTPSLVKLLSVLVEIFGPIPLFLKNYLKYDKESDVKSYLELFNDDLLPWCFNGKYSTYKSKIDLLLSLFQDESFFEQWCSIIKYTRAEQNHSIDDKTSNIKDRLELLTLVLQKVRERIARGKLRNLQKNGYLPEHWRHDLLDSTAASVLCDLPASDLHVSFVWYVLFNPFGFVPS